MKNYADLGADNTLLDLHNSSYHTQPHPIIANNNNKNNNINNNNNNNNNNNIKFFPAHLKTQCTSALLYKKYIT